MIFIDSDAFIGIIAPQDAHYAAANAVFDRLGTTEEKLVTSWETIDEVATKVRMYFGKDCADMLFSLLAKAKITIVYVDQALAQTIVEIFKKQTSKNVSLTDCANIAICRLLGITSVFSFDSHYQKNGLKLLS
ncbi:type II toxin-antitoxin system VapC family toxin [Candidatus Gottesmanbacteria bacterium]|nr:type II toxin-antitoxin system VapC family toxin [Candidatus Gottesmanbacteria bacterium]